MNPSEEIKGKLDIVEVIGEYLQLRPAGSNFRANCPFHNEKTPSFMVSPEKQIWHCFGCHKGGDLITFVMEMEGLEFMEALRQLAPKAGVVLKNTDFKESSRRNRLLDILAVARDFYYLQLAKSPTARKYLAARKLTSETVKEWMIGYSPDSWDDLVKALSQKKFSEAEMDAAGLAIQKEGTKRCYNRFRDRIMFPINDVNGNTVGFTGRISPDKEATEKTGKYINSPQTGVYDKSRILYGLDKAKQAIREADLAIIVEGQMDVITAHQANWKNVVASSGTALTADQLKLLGRYTRNIAFAFDADGAGQIASDRGIKEAVAQDFNIKVIIIPAGKDPDECIKNNLREWVSAVASAKEIIDYFLDKILFGVDLSNPVEYRRAVADLIDKIIDFGGQNKTSQDFWIQKVSQRLNLSEIGLREDIDSRVNKLKNVLVRSNARTNVNSLKSMPPDPSLRREERVIESLISLALKFPGLMAYVVSNVEEASVPTSWREFYKQAVIYYNTNQTEFDYSSFRTHIEKDFPAFNPLILRAAFAADRDFPEISEDSAKAETVKLSVGLRKSLYKNRLQELEKLITQAESNGRDDDILDLLREIKELSDRLKQIED